MPEISRKSSGIRRLETINASSADSSRKRVLINEQHRIDSGLIITLVLLVAVGLVALFSASMAASVKAHGGSTAYLIRQMMAYFLGIFAIFIITKFNIKVFDRPALAFFLYALVNMLLFATFFSTPINNAKRWLSIPIFGQFQPSELMKVVLVYTLASYASWLNKQKAIGRIRSEKGVKGAIKEALWDIFIPIIIIMIPTSMTLAQPHLSGAIILLTVALVCLLASGISWRSWLVAGSAFAILLAILIPVYLVAQPYLPEKWADRFAHVETRIQIFLGSEEVTEDEDYQSRQGKIAIGSGGLLGVGLGKGKQKNNYLPEGYNDYIFSNWVEEMGFLGGIFVLGLFLVLFALGLRVTFYATSIYAQIVAGGITSLITLQALLNIAVNVGAIPPTGISLPFFSYGGSSNLFFLIGMGLLLNVSKYGVSRKDTLEGRKERT